MLGAIKKPLSWEAEIFTAEIPQCSKATAGVSTRSPLSESQWQLEVERCRSEVAHVEAQLRAGHTDVEGLVLALADWSQELRILLREKPE